MCPHGGVRRVRIDVVLVDEMTLTDTLGNVAQRIVEVPV